ncbi:chemotaxis protein methyltransferase Cher2 [bacterium MnTg02]|nr:chemotaxis protein methyltransferase Cher2 [bacterium MnTg02]
MTPQEFNFVREKLKERSGLVLSEEKRYLIESRLDPVAKSNQFGSLSDLIQAIMKPGSEKLRAEVTEAMTINESFFFRDKTPFENLEEVMLPHMIAARAASKRIRIWCAAASTGQEPYSIAMIIRKMVGKMPGWRHDIIGTDLSNDVLEKAKAGLYSQFEVQRGLPVQLLVKNFKQVGSLWQIDNALRAMIQFKTFNLLNSFAPLGTFDIVFCRNVLIYFDQPTKKDVLNRICKQLTPDGFLVLGAAETLVGLSDEYKPVSGRRGLYQVAGAADAGAAAGALGSVRSNAASALTRSARVS